MGPGIPNMNGAVGRLSSDRMLCMRCGLQRYSTEHWEEPAKVISLGRGKAMRSCGAFRVKTVSRIVRSSAHRRQRAPCGSRNGTHVCYRAIDVLVDGLQIMNGRRDVSRMARMAFSDPLAVSPTGQSKRPSAGPDSDFTISQDQFADCLARAIGNSNKFNDLFVGCHTKHARNAQK